MDKHGDKHDADDRGDHEAGAATASSTDTRHSSSRKDHFLQLMFFQASQGAGESGQSGPPQVATGHYVPLRNSRGDAGDRYRLPVPGPAAPIRLDSPAPEVMTDLRRVSAVTIDPGTSIAAANRAMIARGVRALFVVDEARRVLGILTATDLLGERPIQLAQSRGMRYDEVLVRDIMTPGERLEVLDLRDVLGARVGDIIATLRLAARQHALVVEVPEGAATGDRTVCGIFSLTQIGRRLGIPAQQVHDIARTFAEIEALIASG